jgi:predicted transcriptional regulator
MKIAIEAIVQDNLSRAEAAKLAGLTDDAVRKGLRDNSAARGFYSSEVKALLHFAKAKAAHALINELDGPNAAARVSAAKVCSRRTSGHPPATTCLRCRVLRSSSRMRAAHRKPSTLRRLTRRNWR